MVKLFCDTTCFRLYASNCVAFRKYTHQGMLCRFIHEIVKIITQKEYRSAYSKFRCGVAPIKLETCRYGLNRLPVAERVCETCDVVEDECHVIM